MSESHTVIEPSAPAPEASKAPADAAQLALLGLMAAVLSACGGGSGSGSGTGSGSGGGGSSGPTTTYNTPSNDADAARFLQQAQFSSTPAEIAALRSTGTYAAWLQSEFAKPQSQSGWDWLNARGYGTVDTNQYCFQQYPADFMLWQQLMSAPDALRKRCALALSEFFVISITPMEFTWRSHAVAHYWDTLVNQAYGNFRQLLEAVTLHPVMGYFLNTKGNQKANTRTGRVPDENYAREVMQLFSIGLYELNLDGSVKTDGSGQKLESYTLTDVSNLAKVFTGYDFDYSDGERLPMPGQTWTVESYEFARKPMSLDTSKHESAETQFLGKTIAANTWPQEALRQALDTLFNHPNVGPFFTRQMIQRLVTSNPSPAYVARVASIFNNNGLGVRGDLKAVWAAILLDDEARNPQAPANLNFGKLREPMLRLIQWARSFGASSAAGSWKIFDLNNPSTQLGQSPLRPPSVFNFFRPGFVPPSTQLATNAATAPEFQLANETSLGGYLNYMQDIIRNGVNCPEPTQPQAAYTNYSRDIQAAYTNELALVTDATALVQHLNMVLCAGQISSANQLLMVNALNAKPVTSSSSASVKLDRVAGAVLMVMASADYLIQK
jgi:uncharacterized protein (DUF1800 family)